MENLKVALSVPRRHTKRVKTALEAQNLLDRTTRITPKCTSDPDAEPHMIISTTILYPPKDSKTPSNRNYDAQIGTILADLSLQDIHNEITAVQSSASSSKPTPVTNSLLKGLKIGLEQLPQDLLLSLDLTLALLLSSFPSTYTLYTPMLLLPPNALTSPPWTTLLASHSPTSSLLQSVWKQLAEAVGATHVAINAGIPLQHAHTHATTTPEPSENILRSPTNLTPLYGVFGPPPTSRTLAQPTAEDFTSGFWVSHIQNGIHQIWAPLYTMFSRGNIREKTRLLNLPTVKSASSSTAVDLYAGIGYFAFPYKRAGMHKLLCWELNPWSIEGFRRGALKNKWSMQVFPSSALPTTAEEWSAFPQQVQDVDFLVFQQSNEYALAIIAALHPQGSGFGLPLPNVVSVKIPSIRHVNCGFLPSSKLSWATAGKILDCEIGGWIHAHENVGVNDIDTRKAEVVDEMQRYIDRWEAERGSCGTYRRRVSCEHVERVKTYAPGVLHVVFDVRVGGVQDAECLLS
jgi:tRNA wybutosine-synthesizing protein 2